MARPNSIFIGYRRDDTGAEAGRMYDRLEQRFGRRHVFKDVDSIPKGVAFHQHILPIIQRCRVFIALIGPRWLSAMSADGNRRLDQPDDLVRIELETALKLPGVRVIPVLVNGAAMPRREELPASLQGLAALNAAVLRPDPDFRVDMDRLLATLKEILPLAQRSVLAPALLALGAVVALGLGVKMFGPQPISATVEESVAPETAATETPPAIEVPQEAPKTAPVEDFANKALDASYFDTYGFFRALKGQWSGVVTCKNGEAWTYAINFSAGKGASDINMQMSGMPPPLKSDSAATNPRSGHAVMAKAEVLGLDNSRLDFTGVTTSASFAVQADRSGKFIDLRDNSGFVCSGAQQDSVLGEHYRLYRAAS